MYRKLIYWFSFVLVLYLASSASADLVVHWKLDERSGTTAKDSSSNGYHGTFVGSPRWADGYHGGGVHFTAEGQIVLYYFDAAQPWQSGTVTVWVKADSVGQDTNSGVFSSHVPNSAGFQIDVLAGTPGNYRMQPGGTIFGPVTVEWVHLAVAWNGTSANLYYNGSLATSRNVNTTQTTFNQFALGINRNAINSLMAVFDDLRVYNVALTQQEIQQTMIVVPTVVASGPMPADEATDVRRDVTFNWTPGEFANTHDVYFGTVFADVNNASRANPLGVLLSQGQNASTHDPAGLLEFGQTYYWRVDEVNAPPTSNIVFKGDVWQFTAETFAYPIAGANIIATASSLNSANEGPEKTINGSGLAADDLQSAETTSMWVSSTTGSQPTWIQYELDQVYKLHQMWVWNYNISLEPVLGFGIKDATIEYSVDGINWTTLGTTHQFARASGVAGYAHNNTVDLSGVIAKFVKITANSNWGGVLPQYGLSEVRFFYIPVIAREPDPASGATDIGVENVILSWRAGREAAKHNVYFSDNNQAVIDGTAPVTIVSQARFGPLSFDLGKNYYWRVDEVNEAETPSTWQGSVSNFTTREFLVVDDFEDYNDFEPDRIFDTWIDGWNVPTNGSQVGSTEPPFAEQIIVHGGGQSMPLNYDNTTAGYSEATANIANLAIGQDWTKYGIKTLTLYFHGDPNNAVERMYVKLNGSKVIYDGDTSNIARIGWPPWNIELSSFGVNLRNVTELIIGFERSGAVGGKGVVYFDDIRLYPYSRQFITPIEPHLGGLAGYWQFEGNLSDSSGNGRNGKPFGSPAFAAGKVGQAINLRGVNDYVEITGYKGILGGGAFSIAAWVNTQSNGTMVNWGTQVAGQRVDFRLDQGRLRVEHGNGSLQGNTVMTDGQWHHVALTVSENAPISYPNVKLYLDGNDDSQRTTDPDTFNIVANIDVNIGRRGTNSDRLFPGSLDDVRIYERVLTHEEIAWLAGRTQPFDKPF